MMTWTGTRRPAWAGGWLAALALLMLSGCAVVQPVNLHHGRAVFDDKSSIGVIVQWPETPGVWYADPARGGAPGALLQAVIIAARASTLSAHAKTLSLKEFSTIDADLVAALARKGLDARALPPGTLKDFKPERFETKDPAFHARDMRPLRDRLGVDRLLMVSIRFAGFNYPFQASALIPFVAGDPMANVEGEAFLLDLRTNGYQWYRKMRTLRGVGDAWDKPPAYPKLTAKYYEAVERAKDDIIDDLLQ